MYPMEMGASTRLGETWRNDMDVSQNGRPLREPQMDVSLV